MTGDPTWTNLEAFTRERLGAPLFGSLTLTPSSRLEEDLGLTGVDAVEFMDKCAETFNVSAQGFPYARYFGAENFDPIGSVVQLFSKRHRPPALVPLTLGMLAQAMRLGRWDTTLLEAPHDADNA
ncbi:acyl carrier protein [Caballeronia pedi]|uniref:Acyl carrier protein n=1 Tax=Caballeronia pedi TaxID=1777141 RepID=A0A158AQF1_9BURK|nr:DUF1493 family protein [Caballeronia pedi]SAK59949.1 acyl carrier protein [Caballeronia pedi]